MPKVSDTELRFHAKSDGPQPLQDIAGELLAARAVVEAVQDTLDVNEWAQIAVALRSYDEVTR